MNAIGAALEPLAAALLDGLMDVLDTTDSEAAAYAAPLLEAADRLDTVAYAYAMLPFIETRRPANLPLRTLAELVYSSSVDGLNLGGLLPQIVTLGNQLPERRPTCGRLVATALTPALLAHTGRQLSIDRAVRLFEAAEPLVTLTPSLARDIYEHYAPEVSTSATTRMAGDLRAQLTASLAALAQLRGPDVAATLSAVDRRAATAVACDEYGAAVELSLEPVEPPPPEVENLARDYAYDSDQMLVARAVAFARPTDEPPPPSAYAHPPGSDPASLNEQAVTVARRLFDACPEVDQVDVEIWQPNCSPTSPTGEDVKSLRAGVLRRRAAVARNVAFQAAVAEAVEAESWTRRLREQAEIAKDLIRLLSELPDRLRNHDNARRRRDWVELAAKVSVAVANLPGRPPERRMVSRPASPTTGEPSAAAVDEELRGKDLAKDALSNLASAIEQVSTGLGHDEAILAVGSRFADAPSHLCAARADGAPAFAGLGDTLPEDLDNLSSLIGRLLSALGTDAIARLRAGPRPDRAAIDAALTRAAEQESRDDGDRVITILAASGVAADLSVVPDDAPIPAWRTRRAVLTVDARDWGDASSVLLRWDPESREADGITGRVVVAAVDQGEVLPIGFGFFAGIGTVLPLLAEGVEALAEQLGKPFRGSAVRNLIQAAGNELAGLSYERVRRAHRTSSWWAAPPSAPSPLETSAMLREQFGAEIAALNSGARMSDGDR
ncbi:MAG TPA: hypothetical protein VKU84_09030, partial [Stellaceae bacterium]|nr:hypothetical protein [Stellaceae bacterium]